MNAALFVVSTNDMNLNRLNRDMEVGDILCKEFT